MRPQATFWALAMVVPAMVFVNVVGAHGAGHGSKPDMSVTDWVEPPWTQRHACSIDPGVESQHCGAASKHHGPSASVWSTALHGALTRRRQGMHQYNPAAGGMAVLHVATGTLRISGGVTKSAFEPEDVSLAPAVFTEDELLAYATMRQRVQQVISTTFGVEVFETARPFMSRTGSNDSWVPMRGYRDMYWQNHVDKNLTECYDFSALLYLTAYNTDFEGGRFVFHDGDDATPVEPRPGRLVVFSSGWDNLHQVQQVTAGVRDAVLMWFSCLAPGSPGYHTACYSRRALKRKADTRQRRGPRLKVRQRPRARTRPSKRRKSGVDGTHAHHTRTVRIHPDSDTHITREGTTGQASELERPKAHAQQRWTAPTQHAPEGIGTDGDIDGQGTRYRRK